MKYNEMLLQSARRNAREILDSADTLQEFAIELGADFDTKRAAVTAAKKIRLNACRIMATSDKDIPEGPSEAVTIYPEFLLEQLQALVDGNYTGVVIKEATTIMVKASEAGRILCAKLTAPTPQEAA